MTDESQREAFAVIAAEKWPHLRLDLTGEAGNEMYDDPYTEAYFDGWQTARPADREKMIGLVKFAYKADAESDDDGIQYPDAETVLTAFEAQWKGKE